MTHPEPYRTGGHTDPLHGDADDPTGVRKERVPAAGPLMFLPVMALFVVGLWMMGNGYERDSALVFVAGLLVSGIGLLIPVTFLRD